MAEPSESGNAAADQVLARFVAELGAKQATPGGGAAAAVAAAVGAALGAMAAAYTTGKRWVDRSAEAEALSASLRERAQALLQLADEDAAAYAALQASWRDDSLSEDEQAAIRARAQAVPADMLACCAEAASALEDFLPRCNPRIVSDLRAAIHLLDGAAGAAWETFLINEPDPETLERHQRDRQRIQTIRARLGDA